MGRLKSIDDMSVVNLQPNPLASKLHAGDTLKVHFKVIEGDKERSQVFQGTLIKVRSGGPDSNFTVRRVSHGVGVERTFLFHSPRLQKVEVTRQGRVRRARLYYLRGRSGKAARIKEKGFSAQGREGIAVSEAPETTPAAPTPSEKQETTPQES